MNWKNFLRKILSNINKNDKKDIGIDLGTANTVIYVKGEGIIVNEPSYVSININTGQIENIGNEARKMYGRTSDYISVKRPVKNGVISSYEETSKMVSTFMKKLSDVRPNNSRVIVGIPSGATQVEEKAAIEAISDTGVNKIYLVDEPIAAAIGAGIDIFEPKANLIIDIGGGTTEIAFVVSGGSASTKTVKIAGDHMNKDIIEYVREKYKLEIGEKTAEDLKIKVNSKDSEKEYFIKGKATEMGLPNSVTITRDDIDKAIYDRITNIIYEIKVELENISPEISSDLYDNGIYLSGGGANIKQLKERIEKELNLSVHITDQPLLSVINGISKIFEDFDKYKNIIKERN